MPRDPKIEAQIDRILKRMTRRGKGRTGRSRRDISAVTPEDVRKYKLGSILAGGNSAPGGNEKAPPRRLAEAGGRVLERVASGDWAGEKIPLIWGIDAVHGHANIVGATIFPQNIGLGAMRDPDADPAHRRGHRRGDGRHRHRLGLLADARGGARRSLGAQL